MVQKIKKYKNKILSFLVAIVALPFLTVNSFADVSPDAKNEWFLLPFDTFVALNNRYEGTFNSVSGTYSSIVNDSSQYFAFVVSDDTGAVMPYFQSEHRYLIYFTCTANTDSSFNSIAQSFEDEFVTSSNFLSPNIINSQSAYVNGACTHSFIAEIYLNDVYKLSTASSFILNMGDFINLTGRFDWGIYALDVTLNTQDQVNSIITALNNQTTQLGSQLGDIDASIHQGNDIAENGNETTQENVTEFTEVFDDFNAELDEIETFDDEIIGEFEAANTEYLTTLNNFELTHSVLNAGNWLATSMQTIYDSSSDFKMLWLVPMIFGIPILLFIGKKIKGDDE